MDEAVIKMIIGIVFTILAAIGVSWTWISKFKKDAEAAYVAGVELLAVSKLMMDEIKAANADGSVSQEEFTKLVDRLTEVIDKVNEAIKKSKAVVDDIIELKRQLADIIGNFQKVKAAKAPTA